MGTVPLEKPYLMASWSVMVRSSSLPLKSECRCIDCAQNRKTIILSLFKMNQRVSFAYFDDFETLGDHGLA